MIIEMADPVMESAIIILEIENVDFHFGGRFPRALLQPLPSQCSVQGLQCVLFPLESPPAFQSTDITLKII